MTVPDWLHAQARRRPAHEALVAPDGTALSYAALDARVAVLAARLRAADVRAGDRVLALLPSGITLTALVHAAPRVGAALAPLDPRATEAEALWAAGFVRPRVVVATADSAAAAGAAAEAHGTVPWLLGADDPLRDVVARCGDGGRAVAPPPLDLAAPYTIVLTSGTTGPPRAVVASRGSHLASARASAARLGVRPDERWLACLPLHHVGGLALLLRAVLSGTTVVLQRGFSTDAVLHALRTQRITQLSLVPTTLRRLLAAPGAAPHALRVVLLGGARADLGLVRAARAAGWPVAPTYGLTETCSQVATARPCDAVPRPGFVGAPLDCTRVRVRREDGTLAPPGESGDLEVAGPTVASGVLDADGGIRPLAPGGWLRTADRGALDEHGCFTVLGRADDVIVTGGENVSPDEVESALLAHPRVADAGVAGVPDAEWGQVVCAWVVARPGDPPSLDELRAACAGRLARHKLPRRLVVLDALPRTASGKLRRRALAESLTRPTP